MKHRILKLQILVLVIILGGCTKLDEELFGKLSPDNYYKTEEEALSSVVGIYSALSQVVSIGDPYRCPEMETDEFFIPGRTNGGWFLQDNMDLMRHQVKADNGRILVIWNQIFQEIGTANAVLESLEGSPNSENLKSLIAETRALRAYGYFYAMDFWGNVPIFTKARVDPQDLPATNSRQEVFAFIESEMLAAVEEMPSITEVNKASYYPRFTKEAIYASLATLYLNAEVYTGTARWADALEMSNKIINTNKYALEARVGDCFLATNEKNSTELISSFSIDPSQNAGNNQFILYTNHALDQKKYNLPFAPADGYSTGDVALNKYEDGDERKGLIEYGPQFYLNGDPLLDDNGQQLVLIPIQDITAAEQNEGYHVLKYSPIGVKWAGFNADNDLVLIRYADILLIKAEALFRLGNAGEALTLVNQIRERSNATPLAALTLKDLENERAREFLWEGHRKRDMVRFGSFFTETWYPNTTTTPLWRGIWPIPTAQIAANPNLVQNPNY
ncbi:MAG TPA: RagB/SusD family nutrient uptake outer membrane protein [Saprospiraceae bacterium]|nr:RagB/SusD family nutrient uptake outer membrane protein [Saprospiraceae bacterium]